MIDMLYPRNNLKLIVIEGVSPLELVFEQNSETFLGVDLAEYYGSPNYRNADRIILIQVKYSPTNPNGIWTLNKLCKNKKSSKGTEIKEYHAIQDKLILTDRKYLNHI